MEAVFCIHLPFGLESVTEEIGRIGNASLKVALQDYAEIYRRTYDGKENVADLIPFMLESFINSDHGFKRARKELADACPTSSLNQESEN